MDGRQQLWGEKKRVTEWKMKIKWRLQLWTEIQGGTRNKERWSVGDLSELQFKVSIKVRAIVGCLFPTVAELLLSQGSLNICHNWFLIPLSRLDEWWHTLLHHVYTGCERCNAMRQKPAERVMICDSVTGCDAKWRVLSSNLMPHSIDDVLQTLALLLAKRKKWSLCNGRFDAHCVDSLKRQQFRPV